jgi:TBC1 domain family member 8/9
MICMPSSKPALMEIVIQFIFRHEVGDAYLGAVSRFMSNAFEYGDALLAPPPGSENEPSPSIGSNQPYLNLPT